MTTRIVILDDSSSEVQSLLAGLAQPAAGQPPEEDIARQLSDARSSGSAFLLVAAVDANDTDGRLEQLAEALSARCHFGAVHVNFLTRVARVDGVERTLSVMENHLLRYFVTHPGRAISRGELLSEVWGYRTSNTRTIDVHISSLRRKIEPDARASAHIVTLRGRGYCFRK